MAGCHGGRSCGPMRGNSCGHFTLFKSRTTDGKFDIPDDYGWGTLVKTMDIVEVEGEHLTMFARLHVRALAKEIAKRL